MDIIADEQTTQSDGGAKGVHITTTVVTDDSLELSTRSDSGKHNHRGFHGKRPSMDYKRDVEMAATPQDVKTIVIGKRENSRRSHDDGLSLSSLDEESFAKANELESQRGLPPIEPTARSPRDRQKVIGWRNNML